jgi:hypothetical protein
MRSNGGIPNGAVHGSRRGLPAAGLFSAPLDAFALLFEPAALPVFALFLTVVSFVPLAIGHAPILSGHAPTYA